MSLFIACLLIHSMGLEPWWYLLAVLIWVLGPGDGFAHAYLGRLRGP